MPRIKRIAVVVIALCGFARGASAQHPILATAETPRAEIGVYGGLWNLDLSGRMGMGSRVTVNRSEWLGMEFSLEAKRGADHVFSQQAVIVNAVAKGTDSRGRAIALFTAGAAIGAGSHRTFSPIVGVGLQTLWAGGFVAARGELQYFRSGLILESNKTRVLASLVVAIR